MDVQLDEQRLPVRIGNYPAIAALGADVDDAGLPIDTSIRIGGSWDVTLNLPDGRRTTFVFDPKPTGDPSGSVRAAWTAPADVHATLGAYSPGSVDSSGISVLPVFWMDNPEPSTFDNHDIPGFVLTNYDGTRYFLTRGTVKQIFYIPEPSDPNGGVWVNTYGQPKLTRIFQRTGDQIIIDTNSVVHLSPSGPPTHTIWLERDDQNRITAVHDPISGSNGLAVLRYVYSQDSGNLVQVQKLTDRAAGLYATNKYFYSNQQFPHYITEIDNGIGAPITRNFYDSSGRLTSTVDANNNTTQFIHNLTNSLELVIDPRGNTNTLAYHSRGNITAMTNALNGIMLSAYDGNNNKTNEVLFLNGMPYATNNFSYDAKTGLLLSSTNSLGFTNSFAYNQYGQLTNTVDARGGSSTNYFDGNGNLIGSSDALGNSTTNLYDTNSLLISASDAAGTVTTNQYDLYENLTFTRTGYYSNNTFVALTSSAYTYDSNGNRVAMTNALGVLTCYGFDGQNRAIATTNALGTADQTITRTIYDAAGRVIQTVDARGVTNAFGYDFVGRQMSLIRALGTPVQQVSQSGYDAVGNKTNEIDNLGRETDFQYDALNRQTVMLFPAATSGAIRTGITNAYDGLDRRFAVTNQAGVGTGFRFDVLNRMTAVTNGLGKVTQYQVDPLSNQTNEIDALNRITKFTYDLLNHRTQRTVPGTQAESFGYDKAGRLLAQTNFNGTIITNQYDALGHLWKRWNGSTLLEAYAYSATGQLTNRTDASGTYSWVYDNLGRLKTNSTPVGTLYYTYDSNGNVLNLSSSTANGVSLTYQYDALNRLTNVIDNRLSGNKNTGYAFDAVGNLQSLSYPNGITNLWQYDALNRLTNLTWKLSGAQRGDFAYQLGAAGNRTNLVDNVSGTTRTFSWGYDNLYRLTSETVSGGSPTGSLGYVYDDVGNRTSRTGTLGGLTASNNTFDVNDWLDNDSITNNANPYFDANGNMRTNGTIYYGYDWANRLTAYTNGSTVVTLVSDASGNRIQKVTPTTTTVYLVATVNPTGYPQIVEESTVTGSTTNLSKVYTYGLSLISQRQANGTVNFFGSDGLGSTRFLAGTNGTITEFYAYDAYGTLIASNTTPSTVYLFTGQQRDPDIGLDYLRARYYNPSLGRFWTMDTDEGSQADPMSLHKYVYAADNPINGIDPSGQLVEDVTISTAIGVELEADMALAAEVAFANMQRSLIFKIGAYAILGTTIAGNVAVVMQAVQLTHPQTLDFRSAPQLEEDDSPSGDLTVHRMGGKSNLGLKPQEETLDPPGFSVLLGGSPQEAALQMRAAFPGMGRIQQESKVVASAKVSSVRAAGFDVIAKPSRRLPNHCRLFHQSRGSAPFQDAGWQRVLASTFAETYVP